VLPTPTALTPQLRRAGYFIAMATIFIQVAEVFLRSWPFRLLSPAWRISFVSSASSIAPAVLLMTFVLIAIAIFAGDSRLSLVFSGFAFLAAIGFFVLSGAFMLDSIEIRNQVRVSLSRQYDITSLWTLIRVLMGLAGFVMLAVAGLRSAIGMRQQTARQTKRVGTLIAGNTPTPGPRVGESAGVRSDL
jgi:hypothetical protein